MKRRFTILTAAFALLAILAIPMGMWGQTREVESFTFSELGYGNAEDVTTVVGDDVTLTFDAGTNASNSPKYYNTGAGVRMYVGNTLEVALNDQTGDTRITAIDFTFSGSSYSGGLQNWIGSETSHTFTATGTARIQVIAVTYADGGTPTPTTYTITFNAGDGTFVGNTDFPNASNTKTAGTYTLPSATPAEGYIFNGWTLGENTYESGASYTVSGDADFIASYTENTTPSGDEQWVLANLADLTSSDVFVIVGNNGSNYAMTNNNGTSNAPAASAVTVENSMITSTVDDNIQWTISGNAADGYTFYPNGSTTTWLYCTNTNNGVRVGTNTNKTFVIDATSGYLKHNATSRYVGIYNSSDWRCYTSYTQANIANQTFAFYKKVTGEVLPPSITAANVDIEYNATSGSITYTINNGVEGGTLTAATESEWLTLPNSFASPIEFTCTANEAGTARTATVTLTYTYNRETVTKDVTITQAGNPNVTMTIAEVRAQGTGSVATKGVVTSCVGSTGYIQDASAAICVYGTSLTVGDEIRVSGTLSTYHGLLEITNPEVTVISQDNIVNPEVMTIADINASTNQGWYVRIEDATVTEISGQNTTIVQGENTIVVRGISDVEYAVNDVLSLNGNIGCYDGNQIANPQNVEVQAAPAVPYTLTVEPFENLELITFVNDEMVMEGDGEIQVNEGDQIMLSIVAAEGYVMQTLMMNGVNHVNDIADDFTYSFEMPGENVTISATAVEDVPPTPGDKYVKVTSTANLTSGQYLIVYEDGGLAFDGSLETLDAASNTIEVTINDSEIGIDNITIASEFTIDVTAGTIMSASGYYIGQTSNANGMQTSLETAYTNTISIDDSGNAVVVASGGAYLRYNATSGQDRFRYYRSSSYTAQKAIQLYKKVGEPATEIYTLEIAGYGDSDGGYYLIASPAAINPATVEDPETHENMILTGDDAVNYDLYAFDQTEEDEWRNYKQEAFNLQPGKGYLYAHKRGGNFAIVGVPYSGNGEVTLSKTAGVEWEGWNLVGNPFNEIAYIADGRSFYTMNLTGSEIIATTNNSIEAMEGMFVIANYDGETMTFTTEVPNNDKSTLALNLSNGRNIIDRAIVSFNEGRQLPKFQLNPNHTKVYISQDNKDYAVVNAEEMGEMPVSFKAEKNGSYTLSINAEGVSFTYLHLIDNMTGADVDLLATPSYSFEARTNDYASRFRLVFNANSSVNEQNSEAFAFFNGNNLVINNEGEATLQVIDMMGRMISSEQINGSYSNSLNLSAGVYVLRLSNGNNVKTQKIVID